LNNDGYYGSDCSQGAANHVAIYPPSLTLTPARGPAIPSMTTHDVVGGGLRNLLLAIPLRRLDCIEY
jgi:hypothetical protein